MVVRRAVPADVPGIATLVEAFAREGQILPRSPESIHRGIGDWFVALEHEELLACGSLFTYPDGLAEVRSLVVRGSAQGRGLGTALVTALTAEAEARGMHRLFALTRAVRFFERIGFHRTYKLEFPEKVWRDCTLCPFLTHCDETAVVLDLVATMPSLVIPLARVKGARHVHINRR